MTLIDVTSKRGKTIDDGAGAVSPTPKSTSPPDVGSILVDS